MTPLVLLCVLVALAYASVSSDQRIIVQQGAGILVYEEQMLKARVVPLVLQGGAGTRHDWRMQSLGEQRRMLLGVNASGGFLISADSRNILGPRWRYVQMNNYTLTLSNARSQWHPRARLWRIQCNPVSNAFCEFSSIGGNYSVAVDPTTKRGVLPASLYASIRDTNTCLQLTPNWAVCKADLAKHFAMASTAGEVVLGSSYWHSRVGPYEIDAWSGVVTVADVTAPPLGLQIAGQVLAILTLLLAYGLLWATNTESAISYSTALLLSQTPRHSQWKANVRLTIASWIAIPCVLTGLTLAWVADTSYGPALPALTGPNLDVFLYLLTAYVGAQLIVTIVLIALAEFCDQRRGALTNWRYKIHMDHAWLRSLSTGTAILGSTVLMLYPTLLGAAVSADRLVLYFTLVPLGATIFHHFFAMPALFAQVRRPVTYFGSVFELILGVGLVVAVYWFYLAPTINVTSAYFDEAVNLMAASLAVGLLVILAVAVAAIEDDVAVRLMVKRIQG
jgi:hypothetical protein